MIKTKTLDLSVLNKNQLKAVLNVDGINQIMATAGSGKTRVLTYRIAHMVINLNIDPNSILVATFTKKAAEEMEERLGSLMSKQEINALTMGTFHSVGYHILKTEYKNLNHKLQNFELINGAPVKWLVKEILNDLNIETNEYYNENLFIHEINDLKLELVSPDQYFVKFLLGEITDHERRVYDVFNEYEKRKTAKNQIDFNDMLYQTYHLFLQHPEILKKYQDKIKYILVDEAQDNNKAQYELIKMLAEKNRNIFIVGDDDQSIYGFRGARPHEFINFKEEYPELVMINLEENYRSQPSILNAANNLIKNNTIRIEKELRPFREGTKLPEYRIHNDEDDEAKEVANQILKANKNGKSFNDMAIIYRMNSQSRALEDQLIQNGIPYIVCNGISFYERAEIKDLIAYLKLAVNTKDNESFKRIINIPSRYLGKAFVDETTRIANHRKTSMFDAMQYVNIGRTSNIFNFKQAIIAIKKTIIDSFNVGEIISSIINHIGYMTYLKKENGNEEDNVKIENVQSLIKVASKYTSVKEFLQYIDKVTSTKHNNIEAVKLMTIHKSKGLEFPIVFMVGVSNNILPHKYAIQNNDIEEERRLAYVGITRAKDELYVSSIYRYQRNLVDPSNFIYEAKLGEYFKATE